MHVFRPVLYVASLGLVFIIFGTGCAGSNVEGTIIASERAALDRWCRGEPAGYMELFADEITYFDPDVQQRVNGAESLRKLLAPLEGKLKIERYEMIEPRVQLHGETAVLSYNLVDYLRAADGSLTTSRWNSTEVYRRLDGQWRIVHSHWSQPRQAEAAE